MTWPRSGSIVGRLITLHFLAVVVVSIGLPLALHLMLNLTAVQMQNQALLQQAEEVARYLERGPDSRFRLNLPTSVQAEYARGNGRYAFAVVDAHERVLFSSLDTAAPLRGPAGLSHEPDYFERSRAGADLAGVSMPVDINGEHLWVQVSQDLSHRDALIDDIAKSFLFKVGWVTIPILALLLVADIAIFRRALRPLIDASERAMRIGPTATDIRLPTAGLPRELKPLIAAVNQALSRLEHGFRTQREFTADAAHELRTPLAILRTRVEMLKDKEVARSLTHDLDTMGRLVDQLLDVAELEHLVIEPQDRADLRAIAVEVATFLAPLALRQGRQIAVTGHQGPVWVHGQPEALFHAVRNLAENAIRHTPSGSTVELDVSPAGMLRVMDEGPGVPESEREVIFRRFWRRDRNRAGSAGLGLSIVARVAEAHGGRIGVANRPSGGAVFTLDLSQERTAA